MAPIKRQDIDTLFTDIKQILYGLVPIKQWSIEPKGWKITQAKTKYGMADKFGYIFINEKFLDSQHWLLLKKIFRHEFAHLCVGLKQGHNAVFHQCEELFGAKFDETCHHQAALFNHLISYKFILIAVLHDGREIQIKKTHRKHPKYTQYNFFKTRKLYVNEQLIKHFKYLAI